MKQLLPYHNYHKELKVYIDIIADKKNYSTDFQLKNIDSISFGSDNLKKLWTSTCFEVFEFDAYTNRYIEWNFNKSLNYNVYSFKGYRKRGFNFQSYFKKPIKKKVATDNNSFDCNLVLPRFFKESILQLNMVVKCKSGNIDYYALSHESVKPDFHKVILRKPT